MKYLIGTGFHCKPGQTYEQFYPIWWDNTWKYAKPERVLVLASGGCSVPGAPGQWIPLSGDLGHARDLISGLKPYRWCGWSIAFITTALLAYFDECDFIWKEQDVLAFGPWVETMYREIGNAGMIFGRARCKPAVQSLVLCKHDFIPEFVRLFLGTGSDAIATNEGETKFHRLELMHPEAFTRYSFGCDRDRPIPYDDPVFYAQHLTLAELQELQQRGLIGREHPLPGENYWGR